MDWIAATDANGPIEQYRQALKRILASLVGMAEMGAGKLAAGGQFTFFPQKGAVVQDDALAEKNKPSPALNPAPAPAPTLPRRLYRAILTLLRPAESAARRLIIAAAREIVVTLPPFRPRKPKGPEIRRGPRAFMPVMPKKRPKPAPRAPSLPLFDAPKYFFRVRRRYTPAHAAPRIMGFGFNSRYRPLPPPPTPDDPIDAARLGQRLATLAAALDDLPGQANRFARWKARNDAAIARDREARDAAVAQGKHGASAVPFRRSSPLRRGRPPGGRLPRFDPDAPRRKNIREIDEILAHAHAMAVYAMETPRRDTS